MSYNNSKPLFFLFIVTVIMLVPNLGILPVNIMEARNFITAREMVQDNHWFLTTLNGEPRYEKPPLPTWITALVGFFFGFDSVFVLRLAVVCITLLLVIYIYIFSIKIGFSNKSSFHNGLIVITSFYIYFAGRDNQWDMYCHSFMIISIFYLWGILKKNKYPLKNAIWGGLCLAFSLLSKGPVSLYALLLPFLIAYGVVYKYKFKGEKKYNLALILYCFLGLGIGMSWSAYIHWADPEPLAKMAKIETSRWTNEYNSRPIYYYWSFFVQSGVWAVSALLALLYPYMKNKVFNLKLYKFTLLWTLLSLILLSIIPEKKVRYILPTLIPLALNTGFYIDYLWNHFRKLQSKKDQYLAIFNFGLLGTIGILYPLILYFVFRKYIINQTSWMIISSIILFFIGIGILFFLLYKKFNQVFYWIIALQCSVMSFAFPLAKSFLYNPNYKSAKNLRHYMDPKMDLYDFKNMTPEIVWDYGKKIPTIDLSEIDNILKKNNKMGLLCQSENTSELIKLIDRSYKVNKVSYIDLNIVPPNNKGYKSRLERDFLIISKK